ncbi:MAG: HNH endonuclease [Altererythrobacter sp. XM-24bin4]|nr:MAG: HNH endonuclease [Candidatus Aquiluna sp. XM-24bin5]PWL24015.1 MAG: HNH endonuclease [Altererythrobacter sp. XM-24bin4]
MCVFVLDKRKNPLMPCSQRRARLLLERGRAVVHRHHPFTIRLKDRVGGKTQPVEIRVDPGSKGTGLAVVRIAEDTCPETGEVTTIVHVLERIELRHRGAAIRKALLQRSQRRRRRRSKNLRYRAPRFNNRRRPKGWLPPSLQHRVDTTASWVRRLSRMAPVLRARVETVRFDTQALETPEISGIEYQQGTLAGYEVREYLLEKWGRCCAYCDATGVPLQIDHIHPRARGGSNRVSNLTLACGPCNQTKGSTPVEAFLAHAPKRLARILAQARRPLQDAAAVNATRFAVCSAISDQTGLPITRFSGGQTKWNRTRAGLAKTHANDAVCVGPTDQVVGAAGPTLLVTCTGRGTRQRIMPNAHGFARGHRPRTKSVQGFRTGDLVRAEIPSGVNAGVWTGRIAVRSTGWFLLTATGQGADGERGHRKIGGVAARYCALVASGDGYGYAREVQP